MGARKAKQTGDQFEGRFKQEALYQGLLPLKNHLTARFTYHKKLQLLPSQLDYRLITQDGQVGWFDCKSFNDIKFSYSNLEEEQVKQAVLLNDWNVPAGFVVWFRKSNRVVFFTGKEIAFKGPGNSFGDTEGLYLGRPERFDLRALFVKIG